jgi:hypothetical protein
MRLKGEKNDRAVSFFRMMDHQGDQERKTEHSGFVVVNFNTTRTLSLRDLG